ncbi:MAG TPA: glycosyltransferase [Candidatus Staskawiczbacteria bacterium]|nr:glycosyltransferase [Candidatus Staskawiczbacteria bacterium]
MVSIIIPTLNEEDYLGKLLRSIKDQPDFDYEIIVADAGSTDKTLDIAREFGCKIISGGLPAKGRNEGAKIAQGEILFFVDADVVLPEKFFEKSLSEFKRRNLDMASFCITPIPKNWFSTLALNLSYNYMIVILEQILPHAATGIFMKKDLFIKTGGFDEEIKLSEDHSLARYAKKTFKIRFGIIRSSRILVADRRFKTDGWLNIAVKYFLCELHLIFIGPVKSDIFNYRFNHYKKIKK